MLTRDLLTAATPPEPERRPTTTAPDLSELADTLAALAFDFEAGRMASGNVANLTALTLAADDLLSLAAALAPDPWPYLVALAAVGSLPTGADAHRPEPIPWPSSGQDAAAA